MREKAKIRTKSPKRSTSWKVREWERLGVKVSAEEADRPMLILEKVMQGYLKGSGTNLDDFGFQTPHKAWVAPRGPSKAHKAFVLHGDEDTCAEILTWAKALHICYLTETGWISQDNSGAASNYLTHIGADIWRQVCERAAKDQEGEKVFLTPLGVEILKGALDNYSFLSKEPWRYSSDRIKVLRQADENNFPIGPLWENGMVKFAEWIKDASVVELLELERAGNISSAVWPGGSLARWFMRYSKLARTKSGVRELIGLIDRGQMEWDVGYPAGAGVSSLFKNKNLAENGVEGIADWAVGKALEFKPFFGSRADIREIFKTLADRGIGINDSQASLIDEKTQEFFEDFKLRSLGADVIEADTRESICARIAILASVPWFSQHEEFGEMLKNLDDTRINIEMLYHAEGKKWLEIAEKIAGAEDLEPKEFVEALKYAKERHVRGIKRSELAGLLRAGNRDVRTEIIRIAGLVQEMGSERVKGRSARSR